MDDSRFDRLFRWLTHRADQRQTSGMLAAALGLVATPGAGATDDVDAAGVAGQGRPECRGRKQRCQSKCVNLKKDPKNCGRCGSRCPLGAPCDEGACVIGANNCGFAGACVVFTTSTTHRGDLGGLRGADRICQKLAGAAILPGQYRAWLSNETSDPNNRFTRNDAPYERPDGVQVAASWNALTAPGTELDAPLTIDERGRQVSDPVFAWTGTDDNGEATESEDPNGANCDEFTASTRRFGEIGLLDNTQLWSSTGISICSAKRRLYCFQQP